MAEAMLQTSPKRSCPDSDSESEFNLKKSHLLKRRRKNQKQVLSSSSGSETEEEEDAPRDCIHVQRGSDGKVYRHGMRLYCESCIAKHGAVLPPLADWTLCEDLSEIFMVQCKECDAWYMKGHAKAHKKLHARCSECYSQICKSVPHVNCQCRRCKEMADKNHLCTRCDKCFHFVSESKKTSHQCRETNIYDGEYNEKTNLFLPKDWLSTVAPGKSIVGYQSVMEQEPSSPMRRGIQIEVFVVLDEEITVNPLPQQCSRVTYYIYLIPYEDTYIAVLLEYMPFFSCRLIPLFKDQPVIPYMMDINIAVMQRACVSVHRAIHEPNKQGIIELCNRRELRSITIASATIDMKHQSHPCLHSGPAAAGEWCSIHLKNNRYQKHFFAHFNCHKRRPANPAMIVCGSKQCPHKNETYSNLADYIDKHFGNETVANVSAICTTNPDILHKSSPRVNLSPFNVMFNCSRQY